MRLDGGAIGLVFGGINSNWNIETGRAREAGSGLINSTFCYGRYS